MTDFLQRAIEKLGFNSHKTATIYALIAIAQELRLIRQQIGYMMGQEEEDE